MWAQLSARIAATGHMRLWSPGAGFAERRRLTQSLPAAPAAVPLFRRVRGRAGRRITLLLALDLDAKHRGSAAVLGDYVRLIEWIRQAGGRVVADVSTSGGRHVLVPLAAGVTVDELRPLLATLAARCPTLDTTPMLNDKSGCITVPGSACREGGHRRLIGSLSEALTAFTDRSDPEFLARLTEQLGVPPATPHTAAAPDTDGTNTDADDLPHSVFEGVGEHRRVRAAYRRHDPPHPAVEAFATTGKLPADKRWHSRSEARQAVLYSAAARGLCLADVLAAAQPGGHWHRGFGPSYRHYSRPERRIAADWAKACHWFQARAGKLRQGTHKNKHTGGKDGRTPAWGRPGLEVPDCTPTHRTWLAHATLWCSVHLRSCPSRHSTAAVLQALAVMAVRAGALVDGVPVVAVGGRSLSLPAGLLGESAVWSVLRRLRETPGSPLLLVRQGSGRDADTYALVTPSVTDPTPNAPGRPAVAPIHPAWSVLGHQHRRLYELVDAGITTPGALTAAARSSTSTVHAGLAELTRYGLLQRAGHGRVTTGKTTLDDIAATHRLDREWTDRITAHQHARALWHRWLDGGRRNPVDEHPVPAAPPDVGRDYARDTDLADQDYLAAVLATGPPPIAPGRPHSGTRMPR